MQKIQAHIVKAAAVRGSDHQREITPPHGGAKMTGPPSIVFSDEASLFLAGKEIRLLGAPARAY